MENLFVLNCGDKVICVFDNFIEFKRSVLKYIISLLIFEKIYIDEKTAGKKEFRNFKDLFTTQEEVKIGPNTFKTTEIKKNFINQEGYKTTFTKLKIIGQHLNIKSLEDPLPFVSLEGFC